MITGDQIAGVKATGSDHQSCLPLQDQFPACGCHSNFGCSLLKWSRYCQSRCACFQLSETCGIPQAHFTVCTINIPVVDVATGASVLILYGNVGIPASEVHSLNCRRFFVCQHLFLRLVSSSCLITCRGT